ncbi:MAG: polyprenyl synthetase family protein [Clostridium sp.]|nr:polyprenyl synthetase family protein [Prevotella sp.]MCM1378134.1 polyprenyl synthetase family protein [Prevotella sp.]MCM1428932.1 polyprenyl synthetase family protein [Clostridium sp.]MCM1475966.1 polyprenyl synthetase family protein [Muribaculaceae bacterium]
MKKFSEFTSEVESALQNLPWSDRRPQSLYEPAIYGMTAGGKRLRPALLAMTAYAFGGDEALKTSLQSAIGIETFHNFTLLHDDVMDKSDLRRGRPTVHAKWDENTAILSGDTMLTLATQLVSEVPDQYLRQVLNVFNSMALEVYEGQRLDMDFENDTNVSPESYVEMIRLKTGALLGVAARIGAILGGASEDDAKAMDLFGNMLGIAFQIQDDWLDTFGDPSTFGKPIGGDILNGKMTFLLVNALAANSGDADALRSALKLTGDVKVKTVTRIFEKMGISEVARKAVASYSSKAVSALKTTSMPDDCKEIYLSLVEKLTGRRK